MFCTQFGKTSSAFRSFKYLLRKMSNNITTVDYLVLGAGSGGVASARRSTEFGTTAAIIEHGRLGGTCVSLIVFFFN